MFRKTKDNLKKRCQFINSLFKSVNFLMSLCSYSNNDINQVAINIKKIISYYLTTDNLVFINFEDLFSKINSYPNKKLDNIIYTSYNGYYQNYVQLYGINPIVPLRQLTSINSSLEKLANNISFIPSYMQTSSVVVFDNIEDSIDSAFTSPSIIFENILKQPLNQEEPIIVGESEQDYYKKIILKRLKNIHLQNEQSIASIINLLNKFIGQNIFITLIQNSNNSLIIHQEDNEKRLCSRLGIPFLNFLSIPSRYKLIMMCAQNRKFSLGTKIDFKTGEKYIEPKEKEDITLPLFYSRYETKCIDDEFIYINTELTGDINYDIDLVYGLLDTNNTQGIDPSNYQANINSIKRKNDIIIRECDGKYLIRNGRHRLLYLKYIYSLYFKSYEKEGILDTLRRNLTIPLYIEKTYSDEINNIVKQLKEKYRDIYLLKIDITNDEIELLIIVNENIYYVKNIIELNELFKKLLINKTENEFLLDKTTNTKEIDYEKLKNYLISTLEEDIYTMNLLDLINYIKKTPISINGLSINKCTLNYYQIYYIYLYISHTNQLDNIFNQPHTMITYAKEKYKRSKIGEIIIKMLDENPKLIELDWDKFLEVLLNNPQLKNYDEELLKESAYQEGYNVLRYIYKTKP